MCWRRQRKEENMIEEAREKNDGQEVRNNPDLDTLKYFKTIKKVYF